MNQHPNQALIHIEGCLDTKGANFYLGKKVILVRKAQNKKQNTRYRSIWGKIIAAHGKSGVVKAKFRHNLPAESIGDMVRVLLH